MVRLTRATFFSFALMLGVFAVWALSGFGYPSAPLPTALNIASKILAFVTALTLFLPQRPAPEQVRGGKTLQQAFLDLVGPHARDKEGLSWLGASSS
jgi:hypothetical protein